MVKNCVHGLCTSDSRKKEIGVIFIPFPKPKSQLEKCLTWLQLCNRADFNIDNVKKGTYICSKHFVGGAGPTAEHPDPIISNDCFHPTQGKRRKRLADSCGPSQLLQPLPVAVEKSFRLDSSLEDVQQNPPVFMADLFQSAPELNCESNGTLQGTNLNVEHVHPEEFHLSREAKLFQNATENNYENLISQNMIMSNSEWILSRGLDQLIFRKLTLEFQPVVLIIDKTSVTLKVLGATVLWENVFKEKPKLSSAKDIELLLKLIDEWKICPGIIDENLVAYFRLKGCYQDAKLRESLQSICHVNCKLLCLPKYKSCAKCLTLRSSLVDSLRHSMKPKPTVPKPRTNYRYMTKEQIAKSVAKKASKAIVKRRIKRKKNICSKDKSFNECITEVLKENPLPEGFSLTFLREQLLSRKRKKVQKWNPVLFKQLLF